MVPVLDHIITNNDSSSLNQPITDDEISFSINHVQNNRAPGPDGICIEMYKCTLVYTLPYLNKLFINIFESGNFPQVWGNSIITPVHKKGSVTYPNNYRGISLIYILCSVYTYFI